MITEQSFFLEILNLVPLHSVCYIQAPSLDSIKISHILRETEYPYYQSINLDERNKLILINSVLTENILEDIQSLEIRYKTKLLFEGYDSMEYGTISKDIALSEEFIKRYIEGDMCTISSEW